MYKPWSLGLIVFVLLDRQLEVTWRVILFFPLAFIQDLTNSALYKMPLQYGVTPLLVDSTLNLKKNMCRTKSF